MVIAICLTALFSLAALVALVSLTDSAMRWRNAFGSIQHERALVAAGFVKNVEAREVRLRQPISYRGASIRPFSTRLPIAANCSRRVFAA